MGSTGTAFSLVVQHRRRSREEEQWGSGAVGQWGREEEQIGAIKGCEYPPIGQSDEQRYGGKGTGLYQSLPINPSTIM
jgi:hypothetical protein